MSEAVIQSHIMIALGARKDCKLWRQNTGAVKFGHRLVRFGVKGQGDISGILRGGRRLEIEVKSATGAQSEDQLRFQLMIESMGGLYVLARSVDDAVTAINEATR